MNCHGCGRDSASDPTYKGEANSTCPVHGPVYLCPVCRAEVESGSKLLSSLVAIALVLSEDSPNERAAKARYN